METITKKSKVVVDVRNCSPKQRELVIDYLRGLINDTAWDNESIADAKKRATYITLNLFPASCDYNVFDGSELTSITFNQFLKRANPYRGETYKVVVETPNQDRKAQKRMFKMGYEWYHTGKVIEPFINGTILMIEGMKLTHASGPSDVKIISYNQFMHLDLPDENSIAREVIHRMGKLINNWMVELDRVEASLSRIKRL